jgi:hypothetical protein
MFIRNVANHVSIHGVTTQNNTIDIVASVKNLKKYLYSGTSELPVRDETPNL